MICVSANPAEDSTLVVDRLDPGGIHRPVEIVRGPGGKAVNVARAATLLGADAGVLALLPSGEPASAGAFASGLETEGIGLAAVEAPGTLRRCTSILDAATGSMTDLYERGATIDGATWERFAAAVAARVGAGERTVFSGSVPPGVEPAAFGELVRSAVANGTAVALDTSGKALAACEGLPIDLVKVNEAEALELTEGESDGELAVAVRGRFAPATDAVVTLGARGAIAVGPDGETLRATLDREPGSYPVGSGDAFLAGYLLATERGDAVDDRLRLAAAAGAANADVIGAGRLDPDLVAALACEVTVGPAAPTR